LARHRAGDELLVSKVSQGDATCRFGHDLTRPLALHIDNHGGYFCRLCQLHVMKAHYEREIAKIEGQS
jgi:hypothetical protein